MSAPVLTLLADWLAGWLAVALLTVFAMPACISLPSLARLLLAGLALLLNGAAQAQPCPGPTAVSVVNITSVTADVTFTPPAGATSFVATLQAAGGPVTTVSPAPLSIPFTLTGLVPGTAYTVCVRATCAGGSASTAACSGSFTTTTTPCPTPVIVSAGSATAYAIILTLSTPPSGAGLVTEYRITTTPVLGGQPIITSTQSLAPLITGLQPDTEYDFSVVSVCGPTFTSAPVTIRTYTSPLPCLPPILISANILSPTSVSVDFVPNPNGTAVVGGYRIVALARSVGNDVIANAPGSPAVLTGLVPGSTYSIQIQQRCRNNITSLPGLSFSPFTLPLSTRHAAITAQISLAPNPAHAAATLTLPPALRGAAGSVRLRNALGQTVREVPLAAAIGTTELPLLGLSTGLYLVEVPVMLPSGPAVVLKRLMVE